MIKVISTDEKSIQNVVGVIERLINNSKAMLQVYKEEHPEVENNLFTENLCSKIFAYSLILSSLESNGIIEEE